MDEEDFKDYVNPHTKHEVTALCDPYLRTVPSGSVIQLERKGFYRVDVAYDGVNAPVLFCIPDGKKEKNLAEKYNL